MPVPTAHVSSALTLLLLLPPSTSSLCGEGIPRPSLCVFKCVERYTAHTNFLTMNAKWLSYVAHPHTHTNTHTSPHKSSIAAGLTGTPTRSKVALADCGTFQGRFKCLLGTLLCVSFNFLGLSLVGTHFYFQHRQLMAQNCSTYCCFPLSLFLSLSLYLRVCLAFV